MLARYLLVVGIAILVIVLAALYLFCELLIRHERKKAPQYRKHYYRSALDGEAAKALNGGSMVSLGGGKSGTGVRTGYLLIPLNQKDGQDEDRNVASAPPQAKNRGEDPRSDEAWKKDSGNESKYADRKEDPWVCQKVIVAAPLSSTSKPVEEPAVEEIKKAAETTGIADAAALAAAGIVIEPQRDTDQGPSGNSSANSGLPAPPPLEKEQSVPEHPTPHFSTVGFWEAREKNPDGTFATHNVGDGINPNGYAGDGSTSTPFGADYAGGLVEKLGLADSNNESYM